MRWLAKWFLGACSLFLGVKAVTALGIRGIAVDGAPSALVVIAILTVVNQVLGPLVGFVAWPLNCLTLGLFRLVVSALLFWWVGTLGLGLRVDGFVPAVAGSLAVSLISGVLDQLVPVGRKRGR